MNRPRFVTILDYSQLIDGNLVVHCHNKSSALRFPLNRLHGKYVLHRAELPIEQPSSPRIQPYHALPIILQENCDASQHNAPRDMGMCSSLKPRNIETYILYWSPTIWGMRLWSTTIAHPLLSLGICKTTPPGCRLGVSIGAGVLTTCNWLPKLFKNLKLDFLI
jgi:hypothetical protein